MASHSTPAALTGLAGSGPQTVSHRPLRREGAQYILSTAEEALMEAMMRSSPPPEPLLGKRVRDDDQPGDNDDHGTDADEEGPSITQLQPSIPSISNLTAATLRYAAKKKLRPDQRDEIEAFFSVSV